MPMRDPEGMPESLAMTAAERIQAMADLRNSITRMQEGKGAG